MEVADVAVQVISMVCTINEEVNERRPFTDGIVLLDKSRWWCFGMSWFGNAWLEVALWGPF